MGCSASKARTRSRDVLENCNLPVQYAVNGYGGAPGNYNIRVPRRSISMPAATDAAAQGINTDINIVSLPGDVYSYGINLEQKLDYSVSAQSTTPSISDMLKVLQSLDMGNEGEAMASSNLKQGRRISIVDDLRPGLERQLSEAMAVQRSRELQQASVASSILQRRYDEDTISGTVDVRKYIHPVNHKDDASMRSYGYGGSLKQNSRVSNVLSSKSMPLSGFDRSAKLGPNYGADEINSANHEAQMNNLTSKIDGSAKLGTNYGVDEINSAHFEAHMINYPSQINGSARLGANYAASETNSANHEAQMINSVSKVNDNAKLGANYGAEQINCANHAAQMINSPAKTNGSANFGAVKANYAKQKSRSGKLIRLFKRSSSNQSAKPASPVDATAAREAKPEQYKDGDLMNLIKELGQAEGLENAIGSNGVEAASAPAVVQEQEDDPLERFEPLCPPGGDKSLVLYTTSLRGIRKTFDDCNSVRSVLKSLRLKIDERDVAMDPGFREELKQLMASSIMATYSNSKGTSVPRLFIHGRYIGGAEDILTLHEEGEFGRLVQGLPRIDTPSNANNLGQPCDGCGDARFLPCFQCNGSTKVFLGSHSSPTRCPECNENGLVQCPICS